MLSDNEMLDKELLDEEDEEDTQQDKFLTFLIDREEYGIGIRYVTEIIGLQNITAVPDVPNFIRGVINLRGKVIPVMDVRLRFGLEEREYDERTCIIVINVDEQVVGLIVDRVSEVLGIPEGDIELPQKLRSGNRGSFLMGMGKVDDGVKILLDAHKLLHDEEEN